MKQQFMIKTSFAALLLAAVGSASAASPQTSSLTVNATVAANCTITTSSVPFGAYDPFATTPLDATGGVSITCTKGAVPITTLSLGVNGTGTTRRMKEASSSVYLAYELYLPSSMTAGAGCSYTGASVWNATNSLNSGAAPSKVSRVYNVCGRINAEQDVEAGSYSDTVTATVTF